MSTHIINTLCKVQRRYCSRPLPIFVRVLFLIVVISVSLTQVTFVFAAASHPHVMKTSSNWAGYIATGGDYQQASMTWTVPCIDVANPQAQGPVVVWVGIGGFNSDNLVQAGTMSKISKNSHFQIVTYQAWVENTGAPLFQALPQTVFDVKCGDHISSQITGNTMSITDLTSNASATQAFGPSTDTSTGECIVERPATLGEKIGSNGWSVDNPLPNFQQAQVSSCTMKTQAGTDSIGNYPHDAYNMVDNDKKTILAQTGPLQNASSFTVTWLRPGGTQV